MRRNLFLVLALFSLVCIGTNAALKIEEQTEPEYIINNGYSEATAEEIIIAKKRALGAPVEPLYERTTNKYLRFLQDVYHYFDPQTDNNERYHHDIRQSADFRDL